MNFIIWLLFVLPFVVLLWIVEVLYEGATLIVLYVWMTICKMYRAYYRFAFNRSQYLQEREIIHSTLLPEPEELAKYRTSQWEDN